MSKKIISVLLVAVMVLAMGTVALVSVSADLATLPEQPADTYRYYFYMPPQWYNSYTETTGNTAGIYWWEGTDASVWPGVPANAADAENVYYYDVPTDVTTVIWNNFLDGGTDIDNPQYQAAVQTVNIGSEWYDEGESPLYPEGTENFDGMIYVTDMNKITINDYSGKQTYGGEWYYYYGDGKYGTAPVEGDSEVLSDPAINWSEDATIPKDEGTKDESTPGEDATAADTTAQDTTAADTTAQDTTATVETEGTDAPAVEQNAITLNDGVEYPFTVGDVVTYTVDLTAARLFENIQAYVTYDSSALKLTRMTSDDPDTEDWEVEAAAHCPNLDGAIFNAGAEGIVKFNASVVKGYDFKAGAQLINLEFTVIADTDNAIELVVEEMTIKGGDESYFANGEQVITEGIELVYALTGNTVVEATEPETTVAETTVAETTEAETTVAETTEVETTVADTTAADTTPSETEKTEPTTEVVVPTASEDATSKTEATENDKTDAPNTGAAAYIYIVLAVLTVASLAVVVLRKRVNG